MLFRSVNTKEIIEFLSQKDQLDHINFRATQGMLVLKGETEKEIPIKTEGCIDFTVSRRYFEQALKCAETVEISQESRRQIRINTEERMAIVMPCVR